MRRQGIDTHGIKGQLDLLLLAALQDGPAHGYDVIAALRERSGGAFDLAEGTVYPALHRLEDRGLLTSTWSERTGRRRRTYRLTATGRKSLAAERSSWRSFVQTVDGVLAAGS